MTNQTPGDPPRHDLVFLLDVDNTLLDNDRLKADLDTRISEVLGPAEARRFWDVYEEVRRERDFVDLPLTIQRFAGDDRKRADELQAVIDSIPFATYLYPQALEVLAYLGTIGLPVILSDGDPVFQPFKIQRSGLAAAVDGRVLICVHKELELPKVFATYPARHYVAIDDKPRILVALEQECPTAFYTILVLQGKYGVPGDYHPAPDRVISDIGEIRKLKRADFLAGSHRAS